MASKPTTTTTTSKPKSSTPPLSAQALFYMFLLALQFGTQPILTRRYTPSTVCRSTVVLTQEIVKFFIGLSMLCMSNSLKSSLDQWTISSWVSVAVVPAALYSIQNMCSLLAYQHLDALTYNVLNQTKTLSAALCVWLLLGKKQSKIQIFALLILLVSAMVMENIISIDWLLSIIGRNNTSSTTKDEQENVNSSNNSNNNNNEDNNSISQHFTYGVLPILMASFISGLAGAISQKNLQGSGGRNAYFFTMELCVGSVILLTLTLFWSNDGQRIYEYGFFYGWTIETLIPIITMSIGGLLVGLVTKHAGSVRKGFALIFGIFISGLLQEILIFGDSNNNNDDNNDDSSNKGGSGLSKEQIVGGLLAAMSLWLHATNPPKQPTIKSSTKKKEE